LNLSEELNKTGLWKHIESETSFAHKDDVEHGHQPSHHHHSKPKEPSFGKKSSGSNIAAGGGIKSPEAIDADDDFEPITIKIDRASPMADRGGDAATRNETQPLLGDRKTADSKDEKQESSV